MALLLVDNVSHRFLSPTGEVLALREVTLRVAAGEFVALVGPSGCGKSTLLRLVAGLMEPEQGRIVVDGQPLAGPPPGVGVVFQKPTLLPWRSVWQNVALPLEVAGRAGDGAAVAAMVEAVGLQGFEAARPAELSGGMQQRVALARALVTEPRLLLMDEPFGALDMLLRAEMNALLLDLWQRHEPTVLFVTHDIQEAVFLADRVVAMSPRPGHVIGNFAIDLPRPRRAAHRYSPDAQAHVERVWRALAAKEA